MIFPSLRQSDPGPVRFRIILERDGGRQAISGKTNPVLRAGDLVTMESCGGGAYGEAG